jgi:shikimate kinase
MAKITYPMFIIGMPGTGKSTIAKSLAHKLHVDMIDLDDYIESTEGMSIQTLFKEKGEAYFRALESSALEQFKSFKGIVATGGGIVLNERNQRILKEGFTIFIDTPIEKLRLRLKHDDKRPLLTQYAIDTLYEVRYPLYQACSTKTFENHTSLESIINAIITYVEE